MIHKIIDSLHRRISNWKTKLYVGDLRSRLKEDFGVSGFDISLLPYEAWKLEKLMNAPGVAFAKNPEGILCTLDGKSLLLTDWNDIFISVDSLVDFDYGFALSEAKKSVIFDIGANIGDTALVFASDPTVEKVFSFEPLPSIFQRLRKNLELNPNLKDKIQAFPFGLGKETLTLEVAYPVGSAYCATGTEEWHKNSPGYVRETMEIRDAAPIFQELLKDCPDETVKVMKLDCEGAEFDIIPHLEKYGLLTQFSVLLMEFHRTDPRPLVEILKRNSFVVFWQESRVGLTGRLYAAK